MSDIQHMWQIFPNFTVSGYKSGLHLEPKVFQSLHKYVAGCRYAITLSSNKICKLGEVT